MEQTSFNASVSQQNTAHVAVNTGLRKLDMLL
ncbi:hypothetical protein T06_14934 [Trichinella sp. T6]|nr:hypothetical protein T06_14934 [Trichinella sp. T6]